jgi:sulfofructose kinase
MDVLCIGHAAWDISVFVDGYPAENSKAEIHTMLECGGGPAANAACLLSRWGVACGIAAAVGADSYGDRIAEEFLAAGTDITLLERSSNNVTPVSVIVVNEQNGSRTIINRKGTVPIFVSAKMGLSPLMPAPRVLLFDGHELAASLQAMELFPNAKTILDAGSLRDGTRELAKRVDYLVSSERFARQMSGVPDLDSAENQAKALAALYEYNRHPVVITRGEREILFGYMDRLERFPTFPVQAVDTTAAGDIFHGAFAYGVLTESTVKQTLQLAAAGAALSVTAPGGRTSIPSLAQVREMLRHVG